MRSIYRSFAGILLAADRLDTESARQFLAPFVTLP